MKHQIVIKLRNLLHKPLTEECHVVCFMVEIRNLMDQLGYNFKSTEYEFVRFYCDWIVHLEKDKITLTIKKVLEDIAKEYKEKRSFVDTAFDFTQLKEFKKELILFLKEVNLPFEFLTEENEWEDFRHLLTNFLADCKIKPKEEEDSPVEWLEYKKSDDKNTINWHIKIKGLMPYSCGFDFIKVT